MRRFVIKSESAGMRLDAWLFKKLKADSRTWVAKLIKGGAVLVNSKEVKPHYFLKEADVVKVISDRVETAPKARVVPIIDLSDKVEIIEESDDYLVVNKPAGMIVHYPVDKPGVEPAPRSPSLADWLLERCPEVRQVGDDPSRPGIVHRLDKAVSGLIVLAKNQASFEDLKRQFKKRLVKKGYQALVYGATSKDEDVINFPMQRSASGAKMAANPVGGEGKKAITEFKVIKRYQNYTFLDVNLKTGRTHQIRCHLAAYGHPLVGDNIYKTKFTKEKNHKLQLGRVFLVSVALRFRDLEGVVRKNKIEIPDTLEELLTKVK